MMRIEKITLAVGMEDYNFIMTVDTEKEKITQLEVLEDINEEEINIKAGTILKTGRKIDVSFKELFEEFFITYDEDGEKIIDMNIEL